jgi:hypothetical protein
VLIEIAGGVVIGGAFSICGVSIERGQLGIAVFFALLGAAVTALVVLAR